MQVDDLISNSYTRSKHILKKGILNINGGNSHNLSYLRALQSFFPCFSLVASGEF